MKNKLYALKPHSHWPVIVILIIGGLWLRHDYSKRFDELQKNLRNYQLKSAPAANTQTPETSVSKTLTSGKGGFSVSVGSQGWDLLNVQDSDFMLMIGERQPSMSPTKVKDIASYGGDSPTVLRIYYGDNVAPAEGQASDFVASEKSDKPLIGKKYIKEYTADTSVGIGDLRLKGDRDYYYEFKVGNKTLQVGYSVYGIDPNNHIEQVDAMVRSIQILKG